MRCEVLERIQTHASDLTKRQLQVAEYLAKDCQRLTFASAAEIALEAKVSEATVTRLAYSLGYAGYAEMQASVRAEVNQHRRRVLINDFREPSQILDQVARRHQEQIAETAAGIGPEELRAAASLIVNADTVLVMGHHWARSIAQILVDLLRSVAVNAHLVGGQEEKEWQLAQLGPTSLLVAIGFPRYVRESLAAASLARLRGARLLVITDSVASPMARGADQVLPVPGLAEVPGSDYFAGAFTLVDALYIATSLLAQPANEERGNTLQQSYRHFQTFIEED